jgi:uridine kinase
MRALVAANLPLRPVQTPLEDALALLRQAGDANKEALFARRRKDYLTLYELNGIKDYMHGFMVPSTGYLDIFDLHPYSKGFILRFPRRHEPERLLPLDNEPRLATVFQEYAHWLRVVGVPYVAALNRAIEAGRSKEVILTAEAFHQRQLTNIAADVAARRPGVKLVLISGPTSAGKTTFSKRLAVQLMAEGIHPVTLALDDYFVDRERTPRDEDGEYDFEHFDAVDHALFQQHLEKLIRGETIIRPVFDFRTGQRGEGDSLTLRPDQILLVEGIHALNARLVQGLPLSSLYRIYVSAFTQLNLDQHNRVPTTDTRLLRRIVRDAAHRGYSAADTIARWPSVRRGEKRWIFPNETNADVFFNSALVYELAALKPLAYPLLLQVEPGTPERIEANRLIAALQWYAHIDVAAIPSGSLLREFIGGSIFADFKLWAL